MKPASLDGVELEFDILGIGEPVVLVHHGAGVDWFRQAPAACTGARQRPRTASLEHTVPHMTKKASAKRPARGRLRSMRVSSGVRDFVLDLLAGLPGIRHRAMFGGVGLYADDLFFGILASDILYFKVDDSNRQDYESAGAQPFKPYADRAMTMPYYAVPIEIMEDATTLVKWAKRAVGVATASKQPARKPSKKKG